MADEQKQYTITKINPDGTTTVSNSSKEYTGKAQVAYPNGHLYDGEFQDGLRTGTGIYTYTLEEGKIDKYEGEWKDNFKSGIGKMTYSDAGEYFGRFENGKRHGEGVFTYKSKDIYSGSWKYGKKHGKGTYIFNDTRMKIVGEWVNGEIVEGKWIFPNGTYFQGKFEKNKPKGEGLWHFANGNVVKGEFTQQPNPNDDNPDGPASVLLNWATNTELVDPTSLLMSDKTPTWLYDKQLVHRNDVLSDDQNEEIEKMYNNYIQEVFSDRSTLSFNGNSPSQSDLDDLESNLENAINLLSASNNNNLTKSSFLIVEDFISKYS